MKRIAILMSDTGGGHRAAANAITTALEMRYPGQVQSDYVDMYREYTFYPLTYGPELYGWWLQNSIRTYVWYWRIFDFLLKSRLTMSPKLGWLFAGGIRHLADKYKPDLILLVHGGFGRTTVMGRDYAGLDLPICSVVTDPGIPHRAWFHPNTDRCLVPCKESYARAMEAGHPPERVRIIGFAIHPRFAAYRATKAEARQQLGWDQDRPALLLQAGGEGVGALENVARAIDARAMNTQTAIICGKNEKVQRQLQAIPWRRPPHIYGFVKNMEVLLRASDLVVTKAGPAAVHEAAVMGTPLIISGAIPHQEWGIMRQAVASGAAVACFQPEKIAETAEELLRPGNPELEKMNAGCRALATPNAVFEIADEIAAMLALPLQTQRKAG